MWRNKIISLTLVMAGLFSIIGHSNAATINAVSCSQANVQAAINSTTNGDTVSIPSGNCTWTTGVTIPSTKRITLQGAGATATVIKHTGSITALSMAASGARVTSIGFTRELPTSSYPSIDVKGTGWRIDHCKFINNTGASAYTIIPNGTNVTMPPTGLIDNNDFVEGRIDVEGLGTFTKNSTQWAVASVLGTANAVYIEDNTFYKTVSGGGNSIDANRTASYVARYNTSTGIPQFMIHPLQSDSERAPKSWEFYGNTFATASSYNSALFIRSGTGVVFGNTATGYQGSMIKLDNVRSSTSVGVFGLCNGSSFADGNSAGQSGWPCRDQIGRGPDASTWTANTVKPAPSQSSQPAYIWLNREGAAMAGIYNASTNHIVANRDYYTDVSSFNGTSGVGCGTLATRPTTCTKGVGYWATNQSCSNLTGMVGKNPTTPLSGTLYKCTATNTWTAYYTPYTYPHPLRAWSSTFIVGTYDHASGWALETGKTYTYSMVVDKGFIGKQAAKALQGSTQYSAAASIALVESTAGSYYYDSSAGKLYVRCTTNVNPNNYLITVYFRD